MPLIEPTDRGLYCAAGDFYIDPWLPVPRAVITHGHGDHAYPGCERYLASAAGEALLRTRLGPDASIESLRYGEGRTIDGVTLSLHPAGHMLGSAQVRVEHRGEVWVASGDYKLQDDPTCATFEPLRCDTFITEATYGMPIYRWRPAEEVYRQIEEWWETNAASNVTSILYAYALGKAQRLLVGLRALHGPILAHGTVLKYLEPYRAAGVRFPEVMHADHDA